METKKHPNLELTNKRSMLFNLALMISISIVLFAYVWKYKNVERIPFSAIEIETWDDTPDMPLTTQQLPPPPITAPIIIEILDNGILKKEIPKIQEPFIYSDHIPKNQSPTKYSKTVL
jgi:protein TonB